MRGGVIVALGLAACVLAVSAADKKAPAASKKGGATVVEEYFDPFTGDEAEDLAEPAARDRAKRGAESGPVSRPAGAGAPPQI